MIRPVKDLSLRERQVLAWAAKGKTYQETAVILGISHATVHAHMNYLRMKLDAMNVTHAVALGYESGLLGVGTDWPLARLSETAA